MGLDYDRARAFAADLAGLSFDGWVAQQYLGNGKSAVVLKAARDGNVAALKVFDPELVERYGRAAQLARIKRELQLVGKRHPHLIQVFGGGEDPATGYLFLVMELVTPKNLAGVIADVPPEKIAALIWQLAQAARFLEGLNLVHRDIKPANVAVSDDFESLTLLDLGVVRPMGLAGLTDEKAPEFIGTLQYSSPEFLVREEDDSPEGWRAVTFYQLGAVLHDMIMRRPLFEEYRAPYGRLVRAILDTPPTIESRDVAPELVRLARNCLVKDPGSRLELVAWDDFQPPPPDARPIDTVKLRVRRRALQSQAPQPGSDGATSSPLDAEAIGREASTHLETAIRSSCIGNPDFPPIELNTQHGSRIAAELTFRPRDDIAGGAALHVVFECDFVDLRSRVVNLRKAACLTFIDGRVPAVPIDRLRTIFKGVLDPSALRDAVSDSLYVTLDQAQQVSSLDHEPLWLGEELSERAMP